MNRKSDCKFRNNLNAYLDNELEKDQFDQIKDHLQSCTECQKEIRELNNLNTLLDSYYQEGVSDRLTNKILSQLDGINSSGIKRKSRMVNFTIAASIAASFFIGIVFSNLSFSNQANELSELSLGQESLYSYYNEVE